VFIGVRNDLASSLSFQWPSPYSRIMVLRDALKAGDLYPVDVPQSDGQKYPKRKSEILSAVPQGGYWRDLPDDLQREYMQGSYFLGGGKTGMARRLSWDSPSLTLTCAPAQKQTERCHPEETRPLTVREYARIQTFPDDWQFAGSTSSQYKQIGNAVPVNLALAVGRSLIRLLNQIVELESHVISRQDLRVCEDA
jgi:DNA (cytosine-5)-methyltransferase 1